MLNEKTQEDIQDTCSFILNIVDNLGVKHWGKEEEFRIERFTLAVNVLTFALGGYIQNCVKDKEARDVIFKKVFDGMLEVRIKSHECPE